ncbi:MAG TPA: hypothetical protein VH115_00260 [Solirubrobacteraceae bacterium]|nr:hypothetical protein [Solirubrobacteraceae bacterium]
MLCDLLWEELHERLRVVYASEDRRPGADAATRYSMELAERIAELASTVALLAGAPDGATSSRTTTVWEETRAPPAARPASDARPAAVLIDEHDEQTDASMASSTRLEGAGLERNGRAQRQAWLEVIVSALAQFEHDRVPFAVLLVEVLDAGELSRANEQIESAVARALDAFGPASIATEGPDRYWLLVPQADRRRAHVVADRLARALEGVDDAAPADAADRYFAALSARGSRPHAGHPEAPLRLVVGTAACPENGRDLSALVAQAHIELAEARSARRPFVTATECWWR